MPSYFEIVDRLLAEPKRAGGVLGAKSYHELGEKMQILSERYFEHRLDKDLQATNPAAHAAWRRDLEKHFDLFSKVVDFILGHDAIQDLFVQRLQQPSFYKSFGFYRLLDEYALSHSLSFFGLRTISNGSFLLSVEPDSSGLLRSKTKPMPDFRASADGPPLEDKPPSRCPFISAERRLPSPGLNKIDTREAGYAHNFILDNKAGNELVLWAASLNLLFQECCRGLDRALIFKQAMTRSFKSDDKAQQVFKELDALRKIITVIYSPNISRKSSSATEPNVHGDTLGENFPSPNFETIMTLAMCLYADNYQAAQECGGQVDESEVFAEMIHRLGKEPYFRSVGFRGPMRCPFELSFQQMAPRLKNALARAGIASPEGKKKGSSGFVWVLNQVRQHGDLANDFFRERFVARHREYRSRNPLHGIMFTEPKLPKPLWGRGRHAQKRIIQSTRSWVPRRLWHGALAS